MTPAIANIIFIIAMLVAAVIAGCGLYYQTQAINNIRPDSRWSGSGLFNRRYGWIAPRTEFNERGLFHRRRYIMTQIIFTAWALAMMVLSFLLFGRSGN